MWVARLHYKKSRLQTNFNGWTDEEVQASALDLTGRVSLQTPSKKFREDSRYAGSDNEDDVYNNVTINKCFINSGLEIGPSFGKRTKWKSQKLSF